MFFFHNTKVVLQKQDSYVQYLLVICHILGMRITDEDFDQSRNV